MIKIKGVQQKYVSPEIFDSMMMPPKEQEQYVDQETGMITEHEFFSRQMPIAVIKTKQWRRMFTGVSIVDQIKLITFAHKKRLHDITTSTSVPFRTVEDQVAHANRVNYRMKTIKSYERKNNQKIIDVFNAVKDGGSYRTGHMMDQFTSRLTSQAMKIENELRDSLDESRKRFMIRLPKYRWGSVHETIMKILMTDEDTVKLAMVMLPKIFSIVHKAVYIKKTLTKKGASSIASYDFSARVISFCIYAQQILFINSVNVPENLEQICNSFKEIIMIYINEDLHPAEIAKGKRTPSWQSMVDWGLRFLAAPVAVVDYRTASSLLIYNVEDDVPLNKSLEITTLWDRFNRLMNGFLNVQRGEENLLCDEELEIGMNFDELWEKMMTTNSAFPVYDMEQEGYNFVSETHIIQMVTDEMFGGEGEEEEEKQEGMDQIIGKRKDRVQKDFAVGDVLMRDGDAHPQLIENPEALKKSAQQVDKEMSKHHQLVFNIFMTCPDISRVCIDSEEKEKLTLELLSMDNFPIKDAELFTIFVAQRNKEAISVTRAHVIDFTLFFQFLYYGGLKAQAIIRRVMVDWKKLASVSQPVKVFIMAVRIVFQKPSMFPMTQCTMGKMPKKLKLFFEEMYQMVERDFESDEDMKHMLMSKVNNGDTCHALFAKILTEAVTTNNLAKSIGMKLTRRLLLWAEPTPEMIIKLKSILISKAAVTMDTRKQEHAVTQHRVQQMISSEEWAAMLERDIAQAAFNIYGHENFIDQQMYEWKKEDEDMKMAQDEQAEAVMREEVAREFGHHVLPKPFRFERTVNLQKLHRNRDRLHEFLSATDRTSDFDFQEVVEQMGVGEFTDIRRAWREADDMEMLEEQQQEMAVVKRLREVPDEGGLTWRELDDDAVVRDRREQNKRICQEPIRQFIEEEAEESSMEVIDFDDEKFRRRHGLNIKR